MYKGFMACATSDVQAMSDNISCILLFGGRDVQAMSDNIFAVWRR
jgi:hypothetical protein